MRITHTDHLRRALGRAPAADRRVRIWLTFGAAGLGVWALLSLVTPSSDARWSMCLFQRLTHHDCATCGMTRAFALLAKGDMAGSLARHPLALPLAAEALLLWLAAPLAWWRGVRVSGAWRDHWLLAHALVAIGVWVARIAS